MKELLDMGIYLTGTLMKNEFPRELTVQRYSRNWNRGFHSSNAWDHALRRTMSEPFIDDIEHLWD